MKPLEVTRVAAKEFAVTLPGVVLAFNVSDDADARLSSILSRNPGMPVVFLGTADISTDAYSMAENRVRTYVAINTPEAQRALAQGRPLSLLDADCELPAMPGDVSVTAVGTHGFLVEKAHGGAKVYFDTEPHTLSTHVDVAITPPGATVTATLREALE